MVSHKFSHRFTISAFIVLALLLMLTTPALAAFTPSNGQVATLVLGQPNFTSNASRTTQKGMSNPTGIAIDPTTHKVFVADINNNRVLRFASVYTLASDASAEAVLGQPNFTSNAAQTTQSGMNYPASIFVDPGGRLWVTDEFNNRVLRFDHASTLLSGAKANAVLGQPGFTTNAPAATQKGMYQPAGASMDAGGRLWIADYGNSRVLRFNNAATRANYASADGVLGQSNFTNHIGTTSQNGMSGPDGTFVDASGRLWVADNSNNRLLRFNNAAAKANGAKADGVLGQPGFTSHSPHTTQSGMSGPAEITVDNTNGRLYVDDFTNNRVLVFNSAAGLQNGAKASYVLGQKNFTTGTPNAGGLSAATLSNPYGVIYDQVTKVLWVVDYANSRVLMYGDPFTYFSSTSTAANDGWVLESTATSHVGGSLSASGSLRVGDDASNRQYRSILSFDTSGLPDNAVIRAVTLKIHKTGVVGTDPLTLTTFGSLLAEIKYGTFGAAALENSDFQAAASANAVAHFNSIGNGWYQLVLPAADLTYVNLAGLTQFRLRFTTSSNNNHIADYDNFNAGDAATNNRPVLTVKYNLP